MYHIVHNYNQLADRTLFLQGEPYDVEVFLPLIRYKGDLPSTCENIIAKCVKVAIKMHVDHLVNVNFASTRYAKFDKGNFSMLEYVHKYFGDYSEDTTLDTPYGAEFAVDKDKILSHSLEDYEAILLEFNSRYPMADHYQERLWPLWFQTPKGKNMTFTTNANQITSTSAVTFLKNIGFLDSRKIFSLPDGLNFIVNTKDNVASAYNLSSGLGHEPYMIKIMLYFTRVSDTYVEVGANYGDFALQINTKIGNEGKIYAFEPGRNLFQCLSASIFLNNISNIVLENVAVADKEQEVGFFESELGSFGSSVVLAGNNYNQKINQITLDSYFKGMESSIDTIRVDAEGSECKILRGATNIINSSPNIKFFIEWQTPLLLKYESKDSMQECLSNLLNKGFIFIDIIGYAQECHYSNHQLKIDEILRAEILEFLAIKPETLQIFAPADLIDSKKEQCLSTVNRLLFDAARVGNVTATADLLDNRGADINSISFTGEWIKKSTALCAATEHNHFPVVKLLLEHKADTGIPTDTGATPLLVAAYYGHIESLALLIKYGADKNIKFKNIKSEEITVTQVASFQKHPDAVKLLTDGVDAFCNQIQGEEMITRFVGICEENSSHINEL